MIDMTPCIDLRPDHLDLVCRILREYLPDRGVMAFGSRATWTAKEYSDLDLVVLGDDPLPLNVASALTEGFSESDLPFKVDVIEWARIDETFRDKISRVGLVVKAPSQSSGSPSWADLPARKRQGHEGDGGVTHHDFQEYGGLDYTGWRRVPLNEVIELTLSSVDKKSKNSERTVQLCNYTDVYYNTFINANLNFMSATATENEIKKCALRSGDVVITKDSEKYDDIGVPALVRENVRDLVCGYHLAILRPRLSKINGTYLFYALSTKNAQRQFHSYSNGITRFGLRKYEIGLVEIPLPTLPEQRTIAHILSTLDDKIELNLHMNKMLEEMAQALFKSWFIDFDPVRAKMEARYTGLPAHIDDLFPERLMSSEIGEIPYGWNTYQLEEIADHHKVSIVPYKHPSTIFEHFSIPAYDKKQMPVIEFGESIKSSKTCIPSDSVLLSKLNPEINRTWLPNEKKGRQQICSTEFLVFVGKSCGNRSLLYSLFRSELFRNKMISMVTGTSKSHQRVPVDALKIQHVIAGTPAIFEKFNKLTGSLFKQALENNSESEMLTDIRETLLPKLISGEVQVGDSISTRIHG